MNRIADQFSKAAHRYAEHAVVQQQAAQQLVQWARPFLPSIVRHAIDIGCGTGFVTQQLLLHYRAISIEAIDIAPGMLAAAQQALANNANIAWRLANGQTYQTNTPTDVAISGMCFQWFNDLPQALIHWLAQVHTLCFSILLDTSFADWQQAHQHAQQPCGLRLLPSLADLNCALDSVVQRHNRTQTQTQIHMQTITIEQQCSNGLAFARSLRAIGANTPRAGHQPITLEPILKRLKHPFAANYDLAFIVINRS